jgi:hypothetical protein
MKVNTNARVVLAVSMVLLALAPGASLAADTDAQVKAKLDRMLPELNFDGVGLADAIDFLRDVSGAKIDADWDAIAKAGVDRNAPVSIKLKGAKLSAALTTVLNQGAGKPGKLNYTVKNGAIKIAPKP